MRVGIVQGTAVLLDCSTVSGRIRSALDSSAGAPAPGEETLELTVAGDLTLERAG